MPKALVTKFYTIILRDKSLETEEILYYLAHIFNVSKMAINYKCKKLKLIHSWLGLTF